MMFKDSDTANNSIDGLEKQLLAASGVNESPDQVYQEPRQAAKDSFDFYAQDSSMVGSEKEEDAENKMYDNIITKIIDNPKIDKKTLIQRFIAKLEMESNMSGKMASELSQIKNLMMAQTDSETQI